MERKTNFSVITFQCNKWMQRSWHGLQGKALDNGICTALRPGIPVTVHTTKSDTHSQREQKLLYLGFLLKQKQLLFCDIFRFSILNELLFPLSCFWLAIRSHQYSPPVFTVSQPRWPSCLITKSWLNKETISHPFHIMQHKWKPWKCLIPPYCLSHLAFQQHFIRLLSISTR